jgi:predicted DNA-binding WGR domain protein
MMQRGRPWTLRLELHDPSANSHKFWLATGRGRHEPVEIHYGRVGNKAQVIVKDWTYVEAKAPEKEAKGYSYVTTPFVRMDPANFGGSPTVVTPKPTSSPVTPVSSQPQGVHPPVGLPAVRVPVNTPDLWRCDVGGVTVYIRGEFLDLDFDVFPAPWQGAVFQTFRDDYAAFCTSQGHGGSVEWKFANKIHKYRLTSTDKVLFLAIVAWLQKQIGLQATPLHPPAKLFGPYGKVVQVAPKGNGVWHALSALGDKMFELTKQGARDLVAEYPHITVVGL